MRIGRIKLLTNELERLRSFYSEIFGLLLTEKTMNEFTVALGESYLTFEQSNVPGESPYYHFAIDVPSNKIDKSLSWLAEKKVDVNLLPNNSYKIYSSTWDATSIYFDDPAGNIVEFIGRQSVNADIDTEFSGKDFIGISEIGLVVDDVLSNKSFLEENFKLSGSKNFDNSFAAVGDEKGLFIISAFNRVWLGSEKKAKVFKTKVWIEGEAKQEIQIGSYPYNVIIYN